jgi:hypothetical protein
MRETTSPSCWRVRGRSSRPQGSGSASLALDPSNRVARTNLQIVARRGLADVIAPNTAWASSLFLPSASASRQKLTCTCTRTNRGDTRPVGWSQVFSLAGVAGLSGVNVPWYEVTASEFKKL